MLLICILGLSSLRVGSLDCQRVDTPERYACAESTLASLESELVGSRLLYTNLPNQTTRVLAQHGLRLSQYQILLPNTLVVETTAVPIIATLSQIETPYAITEDGFVIPSTTEAMIQIEVADTETLQSIIQLDSGSIESWLFEPLKQLYFSDPDQSYTVRIQSENEIMIAVATSTFITTKDRLAEAPTVLRAILMGTEPTPPGVERTIDLRFDLPVLRQK